MSGYQQVDKHYEVFQNRYDVNEIEPSKLYGRDKVTFAMYLAQEGIVPPAKYYHDRFLRSGSDFTVYDYLLERGVDVPGEWTYDRAEENKKYVEDRLDIFCKENGVEPQTIRENPAWQENPTKKTFAMWLMLEKRHFVTPEFEHDPLVQDEKGATVALFAELKGYQIPQQWLYPPEQKLRDGYTTAMHIAEEKVFPSKIWRHDPTLKSVTELTVAMILADLSIEPPQEWYHDPSLQDYNGNTVAMIFAMNGIYPPTVWCHNCYLINRQGLCVSDMLQASELKVPEVWNILAGVQSKDPQTGLVVTMTVPIKPAKGHKYLLDDSDICCRCQPPRLDSCNAFCGIMNMCGCGFGTYLGGCCCYREQAGANEIKCAGIFGIVSSCITGVRMIKYKP